MYYVITRCKRCNREFHYYSSSLSPRKYCGPACRYNRQPKDSRTPDQPDPQSPVPSSHNKQLSHQPTSNQH